jgi:hypothetical protein
LPEQVFGKGRLAIHGFIEHCDDLRFAKFASNSSGLSARTVPQSKTTQESSA